MQPNIAHDIEEKFRTKDVILNENVTFETLFLPTEIKRGLAASGFKKPSPIQFKSIPLGRCGFDLIVKSKSGTGKTLVFSTVALETVNPTRDHLQVLILVPTREIAVQITDVLKTVGQFIVGLKVESFIGGMPLELDVIKCKQCHIAVGAPGRVKHLITLGALPTNFVRLLVLDEADKLMEPSFQTDINEIFDNLPQRKQLIASSATYPQELETFLANYMLSPTHVTSENETPLLLGLKQFVAVLKAGTINAVQQMKAKNEMLVDIFSKISFTQCLVFTNYQSRTESVCNFLNQKGWDASFISAAQKQNERLEAINSLKNFKSRILLSTDLTSRGIDAPNVDLVINYDLPNDAVTYLHRMGRAGRYGSNGICINFALEGSEIKKMQYILGTIGSTNLSISKLPPLNGINDLLGVNTDTLEQIWGEVPPENEMNSTNLKEEVLALKQVKRENGKVKNNNKNNGKKKIKLEVKENEIENCSDVVNRNKGKKKIKLEELSNSECVKKMLSKKEKEIEDCGDIDAENLLSSLIVGEDEDGKKRKRGSSREELSQDKRKLVTFSKNRALLSITRLLYNSSTLIDADIVEAIDQYLQILQNWEDSCCDKSVEEILGLEIKTEEIEVKLDIEDIFKIGYLCAVGQAGRNWLEYLQSEELAKFQEFCREDRMLSTESEEEEEEDYEMEDYEEEEEREEAIANDVPNPNLEWVPVVPNETCSADHFAKCFEDCSTVLWHNGLTFETVEHFDNWFYQWQEQLQSVRSYVQQNIYVEEMSKYQQSRVGNK